MVASEASGISTVLLIHFIRGLVPGAMLMSEVFIVCSGIGVLDDIKSTAEEGRFPETLEDGGEEEAPIGDGTSEGGV